MSGFDLFGDVVTAREVRRGAPEHVASAGNRNKVMLLQAMEWTRPAIAAALGISLPTLRKHYFSELKVSADAYLRARGRWFEKLWLKAEAGDMGALKVLGAHFDKIEQRRLAADLGEWDSQQERATAKVAASLGKKDAAKAGARDVASAGGLFSPGRGPAGLN